MRNFFRPALRWEFKTAENLSNFMELDGQILVGPNKQLTKESVKKKFSQKLASGFAGSFLLRAGRDLHEKHITDWQMGGSFLKKLLANVYLILHDYGQGDFPPKLVCREETFESEREQLKALDFQSWDQTFIDVMAKPFSSRGHWLKHYLWSTGLIMDTLEKRGVPPGSRLMELGCGMGWLAEFLALRGYAVTGTTIAPIDILHAKNRAESIKIKGLKSDLQFVCTPMEEVHRQVDISKPFDAVYCFEALHHAFDWRESLTAASKCIRRGGSLFLFCEPPALHTYVCYRSAKILKTHEIGFKRKELIAHIKKLGYTDIEISRPLRIDRLRDFWKQFLPFEVSSGSVLTHGLWIAGRKTN